MHQFSTHFQFSVTAKALSCQRDEHQIFTNLGFCVKSGHALFVRGPNGAGKSTLLLLIAGSLPYGGNLDFGRTATDEEENPTSHFIHYIGSLNAMKPEMTLAENLNFWRQIYGGEANSIPQVLIKAGLAGLDNFQTGHLSTGQKHRLSLARLLVSPRPIWLLDEPSSALDADGDKWVAALIDEHLAANGLVIAATHRPITLNSKARADTLNLGTRT